ncbi:PAS domain-containing protein [Methylobacterium mesophilicum SR1.6/6]|uniref:PAS domain-containing protein n=1 Tax=Methylobacterium mesophilicum SR1.6/6 TaxID=908290 RepID=A0A6B9FUF7_9HYPH|nr:PAS domain-containing protein [Methylobacterium mesophilicum]QGY05509.1 PAS domain-containing protein [Methylobacterium mesophilicum SR1.6/6]
MTALELIRALAQDADIGVLVTDAVVDAPGPTILYANSAFGRLVGRDLPDVIGRSPRFMQGRDTRRATLDAFHRALASGERFHGYLTNYRADGAKYRAEIDCRPLRAADGRIENFVSFEREVLRRIGRPAVNGAGRYEPAIVSKTLLTGSFRALAVFEHA